MVSCEIGVGKFDERNCICKYINYYLWNKKKKEIALFIDSIIPAVATY